MQVPTLCLTAFGVTAALDLIPLLPFCMKFAGARRCIRSLGAGAALTGICESSDVGFGIVTLILM